MTRHGAGEQSQYAAGRGAAERGAADRGMAQAVRAEFIEPIQTAIAHEKRLKRWRREWKFALIENQSRLVRSVRRSDRGM